MPEINTTTITWRTAKNLEGHTCIVDIGIDNRDLINLLDKERQLIIITGNGVVQCEGDHLSHVFSHVDDDTPGWFTYCEEDEDVDSE